MMKNPDLSNTIIQNMADYQLPEGRKLYQLFDAVPRVIKETGFNIFEYREVFDDPATQELIRSGKTIGCFYIESPGMRSLLVRTDCHTFEMLTAVSSVIRPGVAESGMMKEFIERHKDPSRRKYLIPEMETYLGETYGVMVYQEDVIKVAHHVVGLSLEEADFLRRAMSGKMRSHKAMALIQDKFFSCCAEKKYSDEVAHELWKQIESFAGYAFCKAHSASFALLSFQVAYLKAHYPAEFMAAVLTNQGGYYSSAVYISEAQRLGIKVLLPSINASSYAYTGMGKKIRIGLMAIRSMGGEHAAAIIAEREAHGRYTSLADFLSRTRSGYEQTKSLIVCGAMDGLKQTRPTLLRLLDVYMKHRKTLESGSYDLFANESLKLERDAITKEEFSIEKKCMYEYESFGYMVSRHPLAFFAPEMRSKGFVHAADMKQYHNRRVNMTGWYMTSKRIKTSKGEVMKFLSLEDLTGTFEAVIFPKAYEKFAELTLSMGPYFITGRVDALTGNNIVVENLSVLTTETARSITQKDRTDNNFFGDPEKEANEDEIYIAVSLDREQLRKAYIG
jgi:DNA polymerase III alpha subunit